MTNPRGPMVPHEMREAHDRSRIFDNAATSLQRVATAIRTKAYRGQYIAEQDAQNEIEQAVIEAENAIKTAQIEIKRMKDESTR